MSQWTPASARAGHPFGKRLSVLPTNEGPGFGSHKTLAFFALTLVSSSHVTSKTYLGPSTLQGFVLPVNRGHSRLRPVTEYRSLSKSRVGVRLVTKWTAVTLVLGFTAPGTEYQRTHTETLMTVYRK